MQQDARSPAQLAAGRITGQILLDIKAVNFRPQEPYMLTAGWASPVYIDCRKIISYTNARRKIMALAGDMIGRDVGYATLDAVAGGETAGIPYGAWMSDTLDLPMLYVRKKPKGFGRNAQIEGDPDLASNVLLVEDLATDGGSKVNFIEALRAADLTADHAFVVFFYGVFPGALKGLQEIGVTLHYLANWWDVLAVAEEGEYFPQEAIDGVKAFLTDPVGWSVAHGGKGA